MKRELLKLFVLALIVGGGVSCQDDALLTDQQDSEIQKDWTSLFGCSYAYEFAQKTHEQIYTIDTSTVFDAATHTHKTLVRKNIVEEKDNPTKQFKLGGDKKSQNEREYTIGIWYKKDYNRDLEILKWVGFVENIHYKVKTAKLPTDYYYITIYKTHNEETKSNVTPPLPHPILDGNDNGRLQSISAPTIVQYHYITQTTKLI